MMVLAAGLSLVAGESLAQRMPATPPSLIPNPATPKGPRFGAPRFPPPNPVIEVPVPPIGIDDGPLTAPRGYPRVTSIEHVFYIGPGLSQCLAPGIVSGGYGPYWRARSFTTGPYHEIERRVDPSQGSLPAVSQGTAVTRENDAAPPEPRDEAIDAIRAKRWDIAIAALERRTREQEDAESSASPAVAPDRRAHRLLALALCGAERWESAAELFEQAEREDATRATSGLNGPAVMGSRSDFRRLVTRAVDHAHRANTGSAWRLVARLMQAEGRTELAQKMLDRADEFERAAASEPKAEAANGVPEAARRAGRASFRMPAPESTAPASESR